MTPLSLLDKAWRVPATGFSFALLGIGGSFLALIHALVILPLPLSQKLKQRIGRGSIRAGFRFYIRVLRLLGLIKVEVQGLERLRGGGRIIIANHPSLLDAVFLGAFVPNANCVVKRALWDNPFTAGPVRVAGYIPNIEGEHLLQRCREALDAGDNLILFPEGTRSVPGKPLRFLRGIAHLVLESGRFELQPVLIDCDPPTLIKHQPWYVVPKGAPTFRFWIDAELDTSHWWRDDSPRSLQSRHLAKGLQAYFEDRLGQELHRLGRQPQWRTSCLSPAAEGE